MPVAGIEPAIYHRPGFGTLITCNAVYCSRTRRIIEHLKAQHWFEHSGVDHGSVRALCGAQGVDDLEEPEAVKIRIKLI